MNLDYRIINRLQRQGLLPVFPRLFSLILIVFFLTACSKTEKDIELPEDNVESLDLNGVDVDLDAGSITGTTTAMQYSLNSTDGVNGTWTEASDGSTTVTFVEGKVYIRQANKWTNVRLVKTIGPDNIIIVDLDEVDINVAEGHITGTTTDMEYSLNSTNGTDGDWTEASNTNTSVVFVAGNVYVREAADHSNMRLVATIAPAAPAPELVGDDNTNTIIGLTGIHEYRIDDGEWVDGAVVPDLAGEKSVQVRFKATVTTLASETQTLVFTENASLIVIFDDNFDGGQSLAELYYEARTTAGQPESSIPAISTAQQHSGTSSIGMNGRGGQFSRYLNPNNKSETFENVSLEWKSKVMESSSSFSINLYGAATSEPVVRTNLNNSRLLNYPEASGSTSTPLATFTPGEWVHFRIVITGNKYNVYMNGALIGDNLSTIDGRTGVARLYCSMGTDASAVFLDDIKVSYIPTP